LISKPRKREKKTRRKCTGPRWGRLRRGTGFNQNHPEVPNPGKSHQKPGGRTQKQKGTKIKKNLTEQDAFDGKGENQKKKKSIPSVKRRDSGKRKTRLKYPFKPKIYHGVSNKMKTWGLYSEKSQKEDHQSAKFKYLPG